MIRKNNTSRGLFLSSVFNKTSLFQATGALFALSGYLYYKNADTLKESVFSFPVYFSSKIENVKTEPASASLGLPSVKLVASAPEGVKIVTPPVMKPFASTMTEKTYEIPVNSGQSVETALLSFGVDPVEASEFSRALRKNNAQIAKKDTEVTAIIKPVTEKTGEVTHRLSNVALNGGAGVKYEARYENGAYELKTQYDKIKGKQTLISGQLSHSLYHDAKKAGVPSDMIYDFIKTVGTSVDFRDMNRKDRFEFGYEVFYDESGAKIATGDLNYASLTINGKQHVRYKVTEANGKTGWYDDKGKSNKRLLMKTPIDGARLSSGFGTRRHPVLGFTRMHAGVDFAAPTGTPIYAAGDGVIATKVFSRGYGNFIEIRHNGVYSTAYGHMSRFHPSIYSGKVVKQGDVIGYVGTTGLSTGPHLHYEVKKNGTQVNPMSKDLPNMEVADKDFNNRLQQIKARFAQVRNGSPITKNYANINEALDTSN